MNAVLAAAPSAVPQQDPCCFHCGLPAAPNAQWTVAIDGAPRQMCCPGCAAVAQAIVDAGQSSWYATRDGYAATASGADALPAELALYRNDDPRFALDATDCEAVLLVDGIRCAACVWLIEHRLLQMPGVVQAEMNIATGRLRVRWRKDGCEAADVLRALHAIGYPAWPYDAARHSRQLQQSSKALGRRLFVAGLSMMQVMMYVAPAYLADDAVNRGTLDDGMAALMQWASLLLTLPAICYSATPFFRGAWSSLRARALGMDVPVALGIAAAFGASVIATWRGQGDVYYDSVTMFIFLLLCSRWLELAARRKAASALERMQHGLPASASLLAGWPTARIATVVDAAALKAGDVIAVKPGEAFAADGDIIEGSTSADLSLLTGESAPQAMAAGATVPGGAINAGNAVLLRVTRAAGDSTLAGLLKLVEKAGSSKPAMAMWADRVASIFVAALLLLAAGAWLWWHWADPGRAWPVAIAVLVVSCPCALSLATPSALAAATDRLLAQGILVVQPHVLETLHRATHIVFDKTGTLTEGKPAVRHVSRMGPGAGPDNRAALHIAAALEANSAHPIARAISAAAESRIAARWTAMDVREMPGQGLEGFVCGQRYRLGNAAFVAAIAGNDMGEPDDGAVPERCGGGLTTVYLGTNGAWLACFYICDALRADAQRTVDDFLKQGKQVVLLSGDRDRLARQVANQLGITMVQGDCLPQQKVDYVRQLQRGGAVVAMVGDGINDAAVLRSADVSFAMGSGAALAQAHADAVLLNGQLHAVADSAHCAGRAMGVIRQNLAWAMLYNATAIPAAALGWLNPWLSGVGMALSSAVVVINALRLRKA
ncbi:heavy metal translocating P-type ATPase [Pseudoduganella ginsengisoli]|uniref:Heavy metal translocating P-type ATPase n=1 Tax=Pseudoduganella ginsengisoli TaxID=1462440 RepID=A0A6L6PZZ9_9BURK|nr:heavy metal translocating P-type ATPase [Pseudoduganella ginsengisoli]MTW02945.1 heavy metal translocating P-type ATPase [Pseudoduganella ginsengisoli]